MDDTLLDAIINVTHILKDLFKKIIRKRNSGQKANRSF